MIKSNGMENFILSPTRISPHCTPSLIDHFYCNDPILNITTMVIADDFSDHLPIIGAFQNSNKPVMQKHILLSKLQSC